MAGRVPLRREMQKMRLEAGIRNWHWAAEMTARSLSAKIR